MPKTFIMSYLTYQIQMTCSVNNVSTRLPCQSLLLQTHVLVMARQWTFAHTKYSNDNTPYILIHQLYDIFHITIFKIKIDIAYNIALCKYFGTNVGIYLNEIL